MDFCSEAPASIAGATPVFTLELLILGAIPVSPRGLPGAASVEICGVGMGEAAADPIIKSVAILRSAAVSLPVHARA
jgi:hypothetical protein